MSGSNRNTVLAVGAGLILAFIAGVSVTALDYRGDYQERYQSYADTPDNPKSALAASDLGSGAPKYKTPCQNPQGHDESDLCAQWRAANGAKQAASWALWQLFLSVFGLVGLGYTLWFNKRAIEIALEGGEDTERALAIADRNATAAGQQVQIAQETAYLELRAYLSVESIPIISVTAGDFGGNLVIRNAGQTPAEVAIYLTGWIHDFPNVNPAANGPAPYRVWQHRRFINKGSEESVQWFYPAVGEGPAEVASLVANCQKRGFYLYGRVEFVDYARIDRVLHFAFRNNGNVTIGTPFPMIACPLGNHYENRGKRA